MSNSLCVNLFIWGTSQEVLEGDVIVFWMLILLNIYAAVLLPIETSTCQDFLQNIKKKPSYFRFIDCQKTKNAQLDVLEAKYQVKGQHAAQAEQFLQTNFGMGQLKFICCGWELGMANRGHIKTQYTTQITMFSDETFFNQRQDWPQIPYFTIIVNYFLEEP